MFKKILSRLMGLFKGPNIILVKGSEKSYEHDLAFPKEFSRSMASLRERTLVRKKENEL